MVEYLTIPRNGEEKQYPVRIGYWVMKQIQEKKQMSLTEALGNVQDDMSVLEPILYASLQMGAYAQTGSMDIDIKEEEMPMVLDCVYWDFMALFENEKFFPRYQVEKTEKRLGKQEKQKNKT